MLQAKKHGLGSRSEDRIEGSAIVVYDTFGHPLVLVVEVSPGIENVFSLAYNADEFRNALKRYGVSLDAEVTDMRI